MGQQQQAVKLGLLSSMKTSLETTALIDTARFGKFDGSVSFGTYFFNT